MKKGFCSLKGRPIVISIFDASHVLISSQESLTHNVYSQQDYFSFKSFQSIIELDSIVKPTNDGIHF